MFYLFLHWPKLYIKTLRFAQLNKNELASQYLIYIKYIFLVHTKVIITSQQAKVIIPTELYII